MKKINPNSLKNLRPMTSKRAKELGFGKWMKGKSLLEETKKKISLSNKGGNKTSFHKGSQVGKEYWFKKGHTPWLKGLNKANEPRIAKISGENHYNWRGGVTSTNKKERVRFKEYYAPKVFERDNYVCQKCGVRGVILQAHHKKSWAKFPELRFDLTNVESLCWYCHYLVTFGREPNNSSRKFGTWKI